MQQAIDLLKDNKRTEAIADFKELQKSATDKAEASLALVVAELGDGHQKKAFADFQVFFQSHPNPYPYIYALYNSGMFASGNNANGEVENFFTKLLDDPKANATIRACATDALGNLAIRAGDFAAARKIYQGLHDLKNWSTLGVFENVSGSGFQKDFGALAHPEPDHDFTSKSGAVVRWFDIKDARTDRWVDMTYHHNITDALIYSQTFVQSDEDKDVLLMVGVSGSLKVWLNDYLVGEENEERNTDEDVYNYRVRLHKGENRLLIQTGSSEISRNNFLVRMAGIDGNLLTNLTSSAHGQSYSAAQPYDVQRQPLFAETYFEQEVARNPDNFLDLLMLLAVYNHNEKKYQAHKTLSALKKIAPLSTIVSERAIETDVIDDNVTNESKEKESIKSNDPESKPGLQLRCYDAVGKENWEEAIDLINRANEKYGVTAGNEVELLDIYSKKKDAEKLYAELDKAYEQFPGIEKIAELKYFAVLSKTKDPKKSGEILKTYLKDNYSETILDIQKESYLKTGKLQDAIGILELEIDNAPYSAAKKAKLAQLYYERNDYNKALDCIIKASELCPYIGKYYYSAGLIFNAMGNKTDAISMMRKCIYFSPANYEAREKLRTMEGKKKLFDHFRQNDVVRLYNDALKNEKYAKEEAVILVNDERQIVYPEHGASEMEVEQLIYVNSQSAIQRFKEMNIPHNPYSQKLVVEKAELLKKDGSKVSAERQKGYVVYSSLAVGDAIHLVYKLEDSYEGKLAEHFWNETYFNNFYPIESGRYSLIAPASRKVHLKLENLTITPDESDIDDYKMRVWEVKDVPKIEPEPLMTTTVFNKLIVSSIPDWNYVADWYSDISSVKTKADFEVKEKVKELMAGNEQKTDLQKARIIYNYIENNYNYSAVAFLHSAFVPQRAARTMSTRLGDCKDLSTLFVSMASEAGLQANLVLVRTRGSGNDNLELPSIEFNHCIAQLHTAGRSYLVELTNNYLPFSAMPVSLLHANGLYIPATSLNHTDSSNLVSLDSKDRLLNGNLRETRISLFGDDAIIHRNVLKIGSEAASFRYSMKDDNEEERAKKLTAVIVKEFNKNVKIENLQLENLKNLDDTLHLDYDIRIDHFTSEIAGMKVFRIPWTDYHTTEQVFALDKRKYPLDLSYFTNAPVLHETISIALPPGKKIVEMPKDVVITSPAFTYAVRYQVDKDRIVAQRDMNYTRELISPADYEEVKAAVEKINLADSKDIAYK